MPRAIVKYHSLIKALALRGLNATLLLDLSLDFTRFILDGDLEEFSKT